MVRSARRSGRVSIDWQSNGGAGTVLTILAAGGVALVRGAYGDRFWYGVFRVYNYRDL